jgi:hypothetical protein
MTLPDRRDLLVPVHNPTAGEVVGRELYHHTVIWQDSDVVHPHLAADVGEHLVPVIQLHSEHGIRQRFGDRALELDRAVLLAHALLSFEVQAPASTAKPHGASGWTGKPDISLRSLRAGAPPTKSGVDYDEQATQVATYGRNSSLAFGIS